MANVTSSARAGSAVGELENMSTDKPNFLGTGAGYYAAQNEPMADEYDNATMTGKKEFYKAP